MTLEVERHRTLSTAFLCGVLLTVFISPPALAVDADMPGNVRDCYDAAQRLFDEAKYELAAEQLDAAVRLAPSPPFEVVLLQARVKLRLKRFGEARLAAELAALLRPKNVDAHFLLGALLRDQGLAGPAAEHFRVVTQSSDTKETDPRVTAAWYALGKCLAETGDDMAAAEALGEFDRAVWERHPEHQTADVVAPILAAHPHGAIEQALDLLKRAKRFEECAAAARNAVQRRPSDPYLHRLYVQTLLDVGRASEAFEHCREKLDRPDGKALVPLTLIIDAANAAGEYERWAGELRADVAQEQRIDLARRLANAHDERGEYSRSVPLWRGLARTLPNSADVAWALATALRETGDLVGALDALSDFMRRRVDAGDLDAAQDAITSPRLAKWMQGLSGNEALLTLVKERATQDRRDFAAYTVLGVTAAAAGESDLAAKLFGAALAKRPDLGLVHLAWGRAAAAAYDWSTAIEQARRALEISPQLPAAYLLLAEAHNGLDEYDEAEKAFKKALEQQPGNVECMLALAAHYRRVGNWLAAQRYFQEACTADPSQANATEELLETYVAGGKIEIARQCLEQAQATNLPDDSLRRMRTVLEYIDTPYSPAHLDELRRQHKQHPTDTRTALKLAAGLFLHEEFDECQTVLDSVKPEGQERERAMFIQARLHLHTLAPRRALEGLQELARRYPRRLNVLSLLAEAQLRAFALADARATLQRILSFDLSERQCEQVRTELLGSYVDFMEYDEALHHVEEWLAENPKSDVWAQYKLTILLGAERDEEALAWVRRRLADVRQEFDDSVREIHKLAGRAGDDTMDADVQARLQYLQKELTSRGARLFAWRDQFISTCQLTGKYDLAERELRAWMAEHPEQRQQFQERLIQVFLAADRPDDALAEIKALPTPPQTAEEIIKVAEWRAQGRAAKGQVDAATQELTALLAEPFVEENAILRDALRTMLIDLLVQAGDYTLAITRCDRWLAAAEGNLLNEVEALVLKRHALQTAGRDRESAEIGARLLKLEPRDPGLNNDVGYTWVDRGEHLERATEMIRLAVASDPMNAAYLDSLGWAYYKQGDFDAAHTQLARAVQMRTGQDPVVFGHLGDTEYRLGKPSSARRRWEKALELVTMPGRTDARPEMYADLEISLRAKLDALDSSTSPPVAPVAGETPVEERP